ncbi:MAG TPA: biliverdin-producing heme oxygenase [Pirellulales bacterium]|jgi:heme oxygenase
MKNEISCLGKDFPVDLRERLKAATQKQHLALESELDLLRPDLTLEGLRRVLEKFYGYYLPCERELAGQPDELQEVFAARFKTPQLASDLRYLGRTDASIAALPLATLQPATSLTRTLGRWYVIEGSTLGGRLLSERFEKMFGLSRGRGGSFFNCYGDRVGAMWKDYCRLLEQHAFPSTDPEVIQAAEETFESLGEWLKSSAE